MLTILHPFEELGQRFGRYKEKQQAFREDQPSDQGDYHWQRLAMTRAKDSLHLVVPHRFFTHGQNAQGDRHVYASRTRFIPAALTQHFECVTWPLATAAAGTRREAEDVRVDVGAKMRSMWR